MKALILAGGFGTRLSSVVGDTPKPMALVAGKPFLEYQIEFLKKYGVTDIVLAIHHMADKIKDYFNVEKAKELGVNVVCSYENSPLGTAGAIKNAEQYLKDGNFLVLNGDSYFNFDLSMFIALHKSSGAKFSLALAKISEDLENFGTVITQNSLVINFLEKSKVIDANFGLINAGVYLFTPEIFKHIEADKKVSIEKETFPKLINDKILHGFAFDGYFVDIGRPETYEKFKKDIDKTSFE